MVNQVLIYTVVLIDIFALCVLARVVVLLVYMHSAGRSSVDYGLKVCPLRNKKKTRTQGTDERYSSFIKTEIASS